MAWLTWFETSAVLFRPRGPFTGASQGSAVFSGEEPPFVPFDLDGLRAESQGRSQAGAVAAQPATLVELGVPAELAHDLEVAFRAMGRTADGQVVGFRFDTLDGASHAVRLEEAA